MYTPNTNTDTATTHTITAFNACGTATLTVNILPPVNQPPTASAGDDQSVAAGAIVTLNAGESTDPDGTIQSYEWSQIIGTSVT